MERAINSFKVDDTCHLEILTTRLTDDGKHFGEPLVMVNKVIGCGDDETEIPMFLTPKQAITLGNMLRECGKEAYANRFDL